MPRTGTIQPALQHIDYELADEVLADTQARLKALSDPLRQAAMRAVMRRGQPGIP